MDRCFRLVCFFHLLALSALLPTACSDETISGGPAMRFEVDGASNDFFATPWPSDLRVDDDGTLAMEGFPAGASGFTQAYVDVADGLVGASISAPTFFTFDGPIDASSLPSVEGTLSTDAPVLLIAVDENSDADLKPHPAVVDFREESSSYWSANSLTVRPQYGFPLREGTRYAVVVTDEVRGRDGTLTRSPTFEEALGIVAPTSDATQKANELYAPVLTRLNTIGVERERIVAMTVFTTQSFSDELFALRDHVDSSPAPTLIEMRNTDMTEGFFYTIGTYNGPIYQAGEIPYDEEGGEILFDEAGVPIQQSTSPIRFYLTVPRGMEMPEDGWPIVLYAHGTGGNYLSSASVAEALAPLGIACIGIDQIHHGIRIPDERDPTIPSFNFINPPAFRDNVRQSATDFVALARFVLSNQLSAQEPRFSFDEDKVYFFGHSQGGINGPLYLAMDDSASAAVLSAAGGQIVIALEDKTEPLNIPSLVPALLAAPGNEIRADHPAFALLSLVVDIADPTHYAHFIQAEPRAGYAPKSLVLVQGTSDLYTPPRSSTALAIAARTPIFGTPVEPYPSYANLEASPTPTQSNVPSGATAGLLQLSGGDHFEAFEGDVLPRLLNFFVSAGSGVPTFQ